MYKPPLIILTGPTSVGKTELSIQLAHIIGGEIISADSMQVYKGMNIGSAKITEAQMDGVKHHLIDICEPTTDFNVVMFQEKSKEAISEILQRGNIPIIVGGTGFYIQALLYDVDFTENNDDTSYRKQLEEIARTEGNQKLHDMLSKLDPSAAEQIHCNNVKRVIRAIEFNKLSNGELISEHNEKERQKEPAYQCAYFVLNDERSKVYARINERVDRMMLEGLLEEVAGLKNQGLTADRVSMQGLGYKEILAYLNGECTLEDALELIKKNTRHFAKRQITWFKREKDVIWVQKNELEYDNKRIIDFILSECKNRGILNSMEEK